MADERTTLALPIDIFLTVFDTTVTQTQLNNNTVLGSADDRDALKGLIEDAEHEFDTQTTQALRLGRAGQPGDVETFEQQTFSVSGHEAFKRNWARTARDYRPTEANINLDNDRLLPFDSAEGDEVRVYRGMDPKTSDQWKDITSDEGDLWTILDHREGVLAVHPVELHRAMVGTTGQGVGVGTQQRNLRIAICYRHGTLGGSRSATGATDLDTSLTASATGTTAVTDATRLPGGGSGGAYILKINDEYVSATVDESNDDIDIQERGLRNTTAASHSSGDRVQYTPPAYRKAVASRAAMSLIQSGRYSAWLPDADDEIGKDEMLDEARRTWETTVEALS